ncbi:hypothetical protein [Rhodopirellula sp. MGV]|uniref:hypothetical protein n=1 Tax=Rhodopirellula sp. MGV TaxID=2023130 RepID=UPI000B977150|nr:hypothetical protein [Rhodopirellula sp. MGV]OYP36381.1 hypothetical protein CGZ80_08715 [Rhodopirellula sp. MGV]PNY38386.1 hypothetical protein C2E31_00065 [Rhodopirellula baltica]
MDGITEPVVLVLGHPIAGNPAQFALERAFDALHLPWRVFSCDVSPERLGEAIEGAVILGFRGLLLDQNLVAGADSLAGANLFWRDEPSEKQFQSADAIRHWLDIAIRAFFAEGESETPSGGLPPVKSLLRIGSPVASIPDDIAAEQHQSPIGWASPEAIEQADLIVIAESIEPDQWPRASNRTLVIDFASSDNDHEAIRELGYSVWGREEIRIGVLMTCLSHWVKQQPDEDVLTEAIEEYLAV